MISILNKTFLSLTVKLFLVTIVFILLLKCMDCDCGSHGIPFNAKIDTKIISSFPEGSRIEYKCVAANEIVKSL
jgi:hypothetical protein